MSKLAFEWVSGRDTGLSSMEIWRHMMGLEVGDKTWGISIPHDPDDFGRCYRLLELIPEWKLRIGEMAQYREWAPLVAVWDEMTRLYERDIDTSDPSHHRGRSADLYELIQEMTRKVA